MDDELRDETQQVIQRSEDVKDRTHQIQDRAAKARHQRQQSIPADPQRAVEARRHEVEALEHAVAHHQQAAELQERHGRTDRAAQARARADHDRDLLAQARAELAEDEADAQEA